MKFIKIKNIACNAYIRRTVINTKYFKRFLVLIFLFLPIYSFSQNVIYSDTETISKNFDYTYYTNKNTDANYWLAATEVVGLNILVWANSKYFTERDWADISLSTIKKNIQYGFTWDGDSFIMNQFLHPLHGSLYFNSARSNGLTFWESAPY